MRHLLISLALVACGPAANSAGEGPGGSGDAGSSGGGGSGSQDGGSCVAATCASAHAGCGPVSDGCGAMLDCGSCLSNNRCIANQCTAVNQMFLSLGQTLSENDDGSSGHLAVYQDQVCFYQPRPADALPTPTGQAGPCTAYRAPLGGPGGTTDIGLFAGDAGTVTVHGGIVDPLVLTSSGATSGCYGSNAASTVPQLFADGAPLSISGSGGLDFPAFSMQVKAPPLIQITTGSIQRGAPLVVGWTGSAPGGKISIIVAAFDATISTIIQCLVDDTNSYTIPASLTGLLEPTASTSFIRLDRDNLVHQEPASRSVVIQADIATSVTRIVTFTP